MKAFVLVVWAMLTWTGVVRAQQQPTLREALNQVLEETTKRCPLPNQFDEPGNPVARQKFLTEKMNAAVCQCYPRNIRNALKTTQEKDLSRQVTLQQLQEFMPPLLQPCMGAMFREMFGGEQCLAMLPAQAGPVPENFCACMKPEIAKFSDAEAVELGASGRAYREAVEVARNTGKPPPQKTPMMIRLGEIVQRCGRPPEKR
jgi:hypothetical protein